MPPIDLMSAPPALQRTLLVRLGDTGLPPEFVSACARNRRVFVGDLVQTPRTRVREFAGGSAPVCAAVDAFLARHGLEPGTVVRGWTRDGAIAMEQTIFRKAAPSEAVLALRMADLGLTTRALNCCRTNETQTVGQMAQITTAEFLRTPGAGRGTLQEIGDALARVGAAFHGEAAPAGRVDRDLVRRLTAAEGSSCVCAEEDQGLAERDSAAHPTKKGSVFRRSLFPGTVILGCRARSRDHFARAKRPSLDLLMPSF